MVKALDVQAQEKANQKFIPAQDYYRSSSDNNPSEFALSLLSAIPTFLDSVACPDEQRICAAGGYYLRGALRGYSQYSYADVLLTLADEVANQ